MEVKGNNGVSLIVVNNPNRNGGKHPPYRFPI